MYEHQLDAKQEDKKWTPRWLESTGSPAADLEMVPRPGLPAAGQFLLALQGRYGNRHVQHVVDAARKESPALPIQAKLFLGTAQDEYEQEAERLAEQMVNTTNQLASASQAGERGQGQTVLRKTLPAAGNVHVDPQTEVAIQQARGEGSPLPESFRMEMEGILGADFSGVRLHTSTQADQLNLLLDARAFTTGQEIFFRRGEYQPYSLSGRKLLAHELAHVLQQGGKQMKRRLKVNSADKQFEQEINQSTGQIKRDIGKDARRQRMSEEGEKTGPLHTKSTGRLIQRKFAGVLAGMNPSKLSEILSAYPMITDPQKKEIMEKYKEIDKSPLEFWTIPQIIDFVLRKADESRVMNLVISSQIPRIMEAGKQAKEAAAREVEGSTKKEITLYRGEDKGPEKRGPGEVKAAGGFFGRGAVTIEHARIMAKDWLKLTRSQRMDWVNNWKVQTALSYAKQPYVATGRESQKGGWQYRIKVTLDFRRVMDPGIKPERMGEKKLRPMDTAIGCDQWEIEAARIIAIEMRGGEIIFLTGIPTQFIEYQDENRDWIPLSQY